MPDRNNDNKISVYSNLLRNKSEQKKISECLILGREPNYPKPPPPSALAIFFLKTHLQEVQISLSMAADFP